LEIDIARQLIGRAQVENGKQGMKELIDKRVSMLRLSSLAYVVQGARVIEALRMESSPGLERAFLLKNRWRILLDENANSGPSDFRGYNPIPTCPGFNSSQDFLILFQCLPNLTQRWRNHHAI
jgi:hypothetical protein